MIGFSLPTYQFASAFRTPYDKCYRQCTFRPSLFIHPYDLRNNFTSLLHIYVISRMQIQIRNNIRIMERCPLHRGSRQMYRLQIGHRSNAARPPHLINNRKQSGGLPLRLKFIRNRPTGRFCRKSQTLLLFETIHLNDDSVYGNPQILPFLIP